MSRKGRAAPALGKTWYATGMDRIRALRQALGPWESQPCVHRLAAWRESGTATPLFRKTSCGVSAAHKVADYNGHWGVRELCDICPAAQADRCRDAHRTPTSSEFDSVLAGLGYHSDYMIEDGHAWTHGLGEQRRYAIQHILGFQIWELDQPHLLHAHGRSLTGYTPSAAENRQLSQVRAQFTEAARSDAED